ncbi:MAG: bifunctional precorrin-2 dehydrogenase/sirohydrochlorin ferrochelatase [Deltaproteobacteria bacterium]|nr:bifunctional precorrin-2 dehydrogenase/sirohydrochlorin ferrochelatase [Deltaproteobacteria bacterium]
MAELYPLSLDLSGRRCLVVGGGRVAERKVRGLLGAAARVTVVAPEATPALAELAERGEIGWRARGFEPGDLDGAALAFVATSSPEANRAAAAAARERGVWLNAAEDGRHCDFHVPAVLRRGAVSVAVSTAGASPALAAWVRDRLGSALPAGLEAAARVLEVVRGLPPKGGLEPGRAARTLLDDGLADDLARGEWAAADEKIARVFASATPVREILERTMTEQP